MKLATRLSSSPKTGPSKMITFLELNMKDQREVKNDRNFKLLGAGESRNELKDSS